VLLNLYNIAQEYSISFSLHLNTFKSYKSYLIRYKDIKTIDCIIHSTKRDNYDNKITLVSFWEIGKTLSIGDVISLKKKYWWGYIFKWKKS
jgi:hypothetical protein